MADTYPECILNWSWMRDIRWNRNAVDKSRKATKAVDTPRITVCLVDRPRPTSAAPPRPPGPTPTPTVAAPWPTRPCAALAGAARTAAAAAGLDAEPAPLAVTPALHVAGEEMRERFHQACKVGQKLHRDSSTD